MYEATRLDGASAWQRTWRITLPLVTTALAVAVLFRVLDALRMYDLPAILTHGANGTTTMSVFAYQRQCCDPRGAGAQVRADILWGRQIRFGYAACEYSLISPPRIGRRWIHGSWLICGFVCQVGRPNWS